MYLAPLNYDRFFRKVFSDPAIAKRFLEDFLETEIDELTYLDEKHRVTDDATVVEFDFRCKIKDSYIIIDMQQWYKPDVVQRFFIYHALNSVLQLEEMPEKVLKIEQHSGKVKEIKDYRLLDPVYTIIWMVDDNLGFNEDYVSYKLVSEKALEFIRSERIWNTPKIKAILKEREEVLKVISNRTRKLDFLEKNHLIFMFQKNIFKSENISKYKDWFEFAEKTRNKENKEIDFEKFRKDKVFMEMIRRLNKSELTSEDYTYIENQDELWEKVNRLEQGYFEDGKEEGKAAGLEEGKAAGLEEGRAVGLKEGRAAGLKEGRITGMSEGKLEEKRQTVIKSHLCGIDTEMISQITDLSPEEVEQIIRKHREESA